MKMFLLASLAVVSTAAFAQDVVAASSPALWDKVSMWVEMASQVITALVILATIVVRVIPGAKTTGEVNKVTALLLKAIHFLPTFGINPRTKALEAALEDLKAQAAETKPEAKPEAPTT